MYSIDSGSGSSFEVIDESTGSGPDSDFVVVSDVQRDGRESDFDDVYESDHWSHSEYDPLEELFAEAYGPARAAPSSSREFSSSTKLVLHLTDVILQHRHPHLTSQKRRLLLPIQFLSQTIRNGSAPNVQSHTNPDD